MNATPASSPGGGAEAWQGENLKGKEGDPHVLIRPLP